MKDQIKPNMEKIDEGSYHDIYKTGKNVVISVQK